MGDYNIKEAYINMLNEDAGPMPASGSEGAVSTGAVFNVDTTQPISGQLDKYTGNVTGTKMRFRRRRCKKCKENAKETVCKECDEKTKKNKKAIVDKLGPKFKIKLVKEDMDFYEYEILEATEDLTEAEELSSDEYRDLLMKQLNVVKRMNAAKAKGEQYQCTDEDKKLTAELEKATAQFRKQNS